VTFLLVVVVVLYVGGGLSVYLDWRLNDRRPPAVPSDDLERMFRLPPRERARVESSTWRASRAWSPDMLVRAALDVTCGRRHDPGHGR
jgi:hypothetical protein